jgi:hypothetical protein
MNWWEWLGRRCSPRTSRCGCAPTRSRSVSRQTSSLYSPKCAEGMFSEGRLHDLAYLLHISAWIWS